MKFEKLIAQNRSMKVTFIDPTHSVINYGLRALSHLLMRSNHDVKIIFMNQTSIKYDYNYPQSIYNDLYTLAEDSDLIGLSFVSNYLGQAIELTRHLKKNFDIPIIWGGIHSIAAPEESLEVTDMICVGEGEACLLQLLERISFGKDYFGVPNLWFKENGKIIRNETAHINPNIDDYSFPLYDSQREFIRRDNRIIPLDDSTRKKVTGTETNYYNIKEKITYPYLTLASRGCPYSCAYCCNNLFKRIYQGKGKLLRRRSNEKIISELETVIQQMPYINVIEFFDDDFLFADEKTISEFASLYKNKIGLPLRCNFRPESVTHEKISALNNAGLISIEMGLQSASHKTNKIFKRHFDKDKFLEAAKIINQFKNIVSHYDIIVDNPFEDYDDIKQTLRFLAELPQPYKIAVYSLTFFPGTQLYEYALTKNLITNEIKDIIGKKNYVQYEYKQPYIKLLILYLRKLNFKRAVTKTIFHVLTNRTMLIVFDSFLFYPLWAAILFIKRVLSKVKSAEVQLFPG